MQSFPDAAADVGVEDLLICLFQDGFRSQKLVGDIHAVAVKRIAAEDRSQRQRRSRWKQ